MSVAGEITLEERRRALRDQAVLYLRRSTYNGSPVDNYVHAIQFIEKLIITYQEEGK